MHIVRNLISPVDVSAAVEKMDIMDLSDQHFNVGISVKDPSLYSISSTETSVSFLDLFESLHFTLTKTAEATFKKALFPSTNFCRIYRGGTGVNQHREGRHCEYTIAVNLKNVPSDEAWITWFKVEEGMYGRTMYEGLNPGKLEVALEPGDAVLYQGSKQPYYRRALPAGAECYQAYFHYVDINGENAVYCHQNYRDYVKYKLEM